jgi:hypothetical protein
MRQRNSSGIFCVFDFLLGSGVHSAEFTGCIKDIGLLGSGGQDDTFSTLAPMLAYLITYPCAEYVLWSFRSDSPAFHMPC